jgi:hypothetical protein
MGIVFGIVNALFAAHIPAEMGKINPAHFELIGVALSILLLFTIALYHRSLPPLFTEFPSPPDDGEPTIWRWSS